MSVRVPADAPLVRRLLASQFPQWVGLPLRPVEVDGWDNATFRLGSELSVRLPTGEPYALAVAKEHRWLPVLSPQLPLPVPTPVAQGHPDHGYPHAWSVYRWLAGETARPDRIADLTAFAVTLAEFLVAFRAIDPTEGPAPGAHNWWRGAPVSVYADETLAAVDALGAGMPRRELLAIWDEATATTWVEEPVWFHGDVAAGNLLVRDGALAAVIDFGTCGVGDPACDLAIAWTLLDDSSRVAFRDTLDVDAATWARGRGWALWKALITMAGARDSNPGPAADARRVVAEILTDGAERVA